jgi:hypothetical protein
MRKGVRSYIMKGRNWQLFRMRLSVPFVISSARDCATHQRWDAHLYPIVRDVLVLQSALKQIVKWQPNTIPKEATHASAPISSLQSETSTSEWDGKLHNYTTGDRFWKDLYQPVYEFRCMLLFSPVCLTAIYPKICIYYSC